MMSKGRILIVEDNMDNYELVRFVLERAGYDVFLAVNGRDGCATIMRGAPFDTDHMQAAPRTIRVPNAAIRSESSRSRISSAVSRCIWRPPIPPLTRTGL